MSTELRAQVARRLARIAEPWTPLPPGPVEPPATRAGGRSLGLRLRFDGRAARALALMLGVVLLAAGWMWWQGRPREVVLAPTVMAAGVPIAGNDPAAPVTTGGDVVVHVAGDVRNPGVRTLPAGSRVADAIEAAGGVTKAKSADSVNLARVLVDGEQVLVGSSASSSGSGASGSGASGSGASGSGASGDGQISINRASASELEDLPGVGPVLAERIVEWRTVNGPFRSIDELSEVSGIGASVMAQIRRSARL